MRSIKTKTKTKVKMPRQNIKRSSYSTGKKKSYPKKDMREKVGQKMVVVQIPQTSRLAGERKYVDGYKDNTTLHELAVNDDTWADCEFNPQNAAGNYSCLPVPKQGNGYADRDGRKIVVKKITIRGVIQWLPENAITAGQQNGPIVRLVVVKDTKTNGAEMSAENCIGPGIGSDGAASKTADAQIMSLSNPIGWGRYQILKDKMYTIPNANMFHDGTDAGRVGMTTPFKFTINTNTEINFNDTTGSVAAIVDNSFHLLAASSVTAGSTPQVSYIARTTFEG